MPELPEVETMRRGIAAVAGCVLVRVHFPSRSDVKPLPVSPARRTFARRVEGLAVVAVERAGKRVVLRLPRDERIVFEPRMTGLVLLDEEAPTQKHVRATFELEGGTPRRLTIWDRRGLGTLRLYTAAEFAEALGPHALGPDALELTPDQLQERLGASRRAVKVALLDQRALAGVGNIYAVEALNASRIDPRRSCAGLTRREWRALTRALLEILTEAVRYEGSTLGDGTYRTALNVDGGYQNHHRVYAREGLKCPRKKCSGRIERVVLGQRATFFCPSCQA
ncbi:MAG: formamidopyrimidine-DNA glycosylase [Planctomycetes bacterium]|nr:formamidopyrimidine-DNA glycosylase [Planctomycetota bacterium]